MATLDSFREAAGEPIRLDLANGYIADIRLNSGDINGRTITVELTDNGTPITTTTGITAALAYNTSPGGDLGDRVTMTAVNGAPTATFRAAVPRKALLKPGRILLGIEIGKDGNKTCSRNFYGIVERAVFDATSPDVDDKLGRIEQLILDAEKATGSANTAAGKATTAADAANTAASAANDKATTAQTAASAANAAAVKANDAAAKATSAAGDARDAAEAARTSVIEYAQLSEDCKAKIAASAAAGVAFATQDEIDAQYETVIEPVLGGDANTPLTQDDIDWALSIINQ